MQAIGYIRVSTDEQANEGVSLAAQRKRIAAWCDAHGYDLVAVHEDAGLSGKRADNRPGLQAALRDVCRSKGVLVVMKLDRLARSTRDAIEMADRIERCGAELASISESIDTTTGIGGFFFTIMAALAQLERDIISERTRAALAHKREQGQRVSRTAPYGFDFTESGSVVPNEGEQLTAKMIRDLRAGGMAYGRIAERLNASGIPSKRGGRWYAKTVADVVADRGAAYAPAA